MVIASKGIEITFSLMGEEGAENVRGVDSFKYLGRILHQFYTNYKCWSLDIFGRQEKFGGI